MIDPLTKKLQRSGLYSTSSSDLQLFDELGLKPFSELGHGETFGVGEIIRDNEVVAKISVVCFPAQFWEIIVYDEEHQKTYEIKTGSGNLSDYWDFVETILKGMLDISVTIETGE